MTFSIDRLARMLKVEIPMDEGYLREATAIACGADSDLTNLMKRR